MQLRWLRKTLKNLDDEAEHIARDDPAAARLVVKRIHHATGQLIENPSLGHPGRIFGTRELIVPGTHYIIPYRVRPRLNQVEILRVFHSSRKPPDHW